MLSRRSLAVSAFLCLLQGAAARRLIHPRGANVASVLQASAAEGPTYNESDARYYAYFASSSYCEDCTLGPWSCGSTCSGVQIVPGSLRVVGPGKNHKVKGFVAQLPSSGPGEVRCVLSYRGSSNLPNWMADFNFLREAYNPEQSCPDCKVHRGFAAAYQELESATFAALQSLNCGRTAVVGHSLGAAVATFAAFRMRTRGMPAEPVYLYGCPRVGNGAFARRFVDVAGAVRPAAWRIIHLSDPVPRVPAKYMGFQHFPTEVYYTRDQATPSLYANGQFYKQCSHTDGEDSSCAWQKCNPLFSPCLPFIATHHTNQLGLPFALGYESKCTHCPSSLLAAEPSSSSEIPSADP